MKIKTLSIILGFFLVLAMVPIVSAISRSDSVGDNSEPFNESMLIITDVDVKVGGKTDKNLGHGDNIADEAAPGDTVEFSIEVANIFTRDDDVEIEDITITVTIEGIDDGDDLEDESNEFDLREDSDEKKEISFEVPLEVDEDTYDVFIVVEGDTNNNGSQEARMELTLEVKKERDEVRFLRNDLTPSEIKCSRNVQLSTAVINTGSDEQEEATLEVSNAELGVSFKETFDLTNDPFDEDSKFRKTYTIMVPEDAQPGIYPIQSKVTYNDGRDIKTETADLTVQKCELTQEPEVECETDNDCGRNEVCDKGACIEEEEEAVVVQTPTPTPTPPVITGEVVTTPKLPTTGEKPLFETSGFLIALIAGEVLLLIIAILIIVAVFRKRRE